MDVIGFAVKLQKLAFPSFKESFEVLFKPCQNCSIYTFSAEFSYEN